MTYTKTSCAALTLAPRLTSMYFCRQEALLSAATMLAESFQPKPTYILVFPAVRPAGPVTFELSVRSLSSDMLAASLRPVSPSGDGQQSEYVQLLRSSSVQEAIDLDTGGSADSPSISQPGSSNK